MRFGETLVSDLRRVPKLHALAISEVAHLYDGYRAGRIRFYAVPKGHAKVD